MSAVDRAKDYRGHRQVMVLAAIGMAGVLALVVAFVLGRASLAERDETIGTLASEGDRAYDEAVALEGQLRALGVVPVLRPEPVSGIPGRDGVDGVDGRDGAAGRNGRDGLTPPCMSEPPQCRGPAGGPGVVGATGPAGATGATGPAGADGATGPAGAPGPACPTGYEPTETGSARGADGRIYGRSITCVDPTSVRTQEQ